MALTRRAVVLLFVVFIIALVEPLHADVRAAPTHSAGVIIPRTILGLYDSSEGDSATNNRIHKLAEIILNHLGLWVDYRDINSEPLPPADSPQYLGVVTWFRDSGMANPQGYFDWLESWARNGKKVVVLGNFGAFLDRKTGILVDRNEVSRALKLLGALSSPLFSDDPDVIEVVDKDSEMVEFERSLEGEVRYYDKFVSVDPRYHVYLRLNRRDRSDARSDVVFTGPGGGFALNGYDLYQDPLTLRRQWRINPFRFFEEALSITAMPRPDPTTVNGNRVFFAHFDGDGFNSISEQDRVSLSAEVIQREIIERYPLPIGASVVVEDVEPAVNRSDRALRTAQKMLARDNVEVASHTYSHPFQWDPIVYSQGREETDVSEQSTELDRTLALKKLIQTGTVESEAAAIHHELDDSITYINSHLLPKGKTVRTVFWSGRANPTAAAVSKAVSLGVKNLNGGLGRFDFQYDSYAWLVPFVGQPGGQIQYYAPFNNDNVYTNLWTGPFFGFVQVIDSFQHTESPRRVQPIDIYYHLYSGQKEASLRALQAVYDWAMTQEIAPLFPSQYTDLIDGFKSTQIERIDENTWHITRNGSLRTVRLDRVDRFPDLMRSRNVIGFARVNDSLYIHLGDDAETELVLGGDKPSQAYLEKSSHRIDQWNASDDDVHFVVSGIGPKMILLANLPVDRTLPVTVESAGARLTMQTHSDADGRAALAIARDGELRVDIAFSEKTGGQESSSFAGLLSWFVDGIVRWIRGIR